MEIPGARVITQFLFGLMLVFAGLTLIPKAIVLYRDKRVKRAVLYTALGGLSFFLAVVAFMMAFDKM
jgi:hypothetical protein